MIFFFYGPNSYAARQQIAKMRDEYVRKTGGDMGLERLDGAKLPAGQLVSALQAAPFLATSRLVIIEDLGQNKSVAATIGDILPTIPSSTVAVFYDSAPDQRTTYFKTLSAAAKTVKFEALATSQLAKWIESEVKSAGAAIEPEARQQLMERCGDDQWRLAAEIAKLAAYDSNITSKSVELLVESSSQQTIFDLVDAMAAGQSSKALTTYHKLRGDGVHEMQILNMVNWQLRNYLLAVTAGKISSGDLAKQTGMSPFVAGKVLGKRHLYTEDVLKKAFLDSVDTEYKIKSGQGGSDVLVEQLIYRVSAAVAG